MAIPALPITPALGRRLDGRPLLLFLDIDGTLASIAPRPEDAFIPTGTQDVIADLISLPDTHVIAISGRAADDARRLVGVGGAWIVGNHGVEVAEPFADAVARPDVVAFADRIATAVTRCNLLAATTAGLIVEDKRWSLSVHYRLADPSVVPALSVRIGAMARDLGLRLTLGRKVLELRAPVDVDKGTAALTVAKRLGALDPCASLVCAGDDRTDEDAFRALRAACPQAVTIRVGVPAIGSHGETTAEFMLADVGAVRGFLETIVGRRSALA